ncbi:MAG: hypothetical protein JSV86_05355 [Gemmatimonadota bacterium]|nr:MAG: hypothetical protein JSV86_05355 [Gemmatimonadota bacterium]
MPPKRYVRVLFWRTLLLWSVLHILTFQLSTFPFGGFVLAFVSTAVVLVADAERRRERRFMANLGVSRVAVIGVIAVWFLGFEAALKLIAGGLLQ